MQIDLPREGLGEYKSRSQMARVATESWGLRNLYCPNCASPRLDTLPPNTPAVDYLCPQCESPFQLKAQSSAFANRIADAAYSTMVRAIRESRTPNLFAIHYDREEWKIVNLILIPAFGFPLSAIEKRKPLSGRAERAGWIGCYIRLDAIPQDAKIPVIINGRPAPPATVRRQYERVRPLKNLKSEARGWTLDVLNAVRGLGREEFALAEIYALENKLARLHPDNRHVRDKIRQQLQVLRDLGFVEFLGRGDYRLR
ncbi:MAG: DpnI domain-containing protein [Candidatus Acidiferrales bacterium]